MTWFQLPKNKNNKGAARQWITPIAAILLIAAAGGLFYVVSTDNTVELEIVEPEGEIRPGDIFELSVIFSNQSKSALENVRLTLGLPKGIRLLEHPDRVNEVRNIGDISWDSSTKETYTLVALPSGESDAYNILVEADYLTGSLSANFEKRKESRLKVESEDFGLSFEYPETVFVGEPFPIEADYEFEEAEGETELSKFLVIEGEALTFGDSEPEASFPGRWLLTEEGVTTSVIIDRKTTDVVLLKGKLVVQFDGRDYTLEEKDIELLLAPSPLVFSVNLR